MKQLLPVLALVITARPATAHPHAWVDQQAILSLHRNSAVIEYRVVPSSKDGRHMFDHLDVNRDGVLSNREKAAYAAALIGSTKMTVDGKPVPLRPTGLRVPSRSSVSIGAGLIAAKASARLRLTRDRAHRLALSVQLALFKRGWFIQPFYGNDLTRGGVPDVRRMSGADAITINIPESAGASADR